MPDADRAMDVLCRPPLSRLPHVQHVIGTGKHYDCDGYRYCTDDAVHALAVRRYQCAARTGDPRAMEELAHVLARPTAGSETNGPAALLWYERAARECNDPLAQSRFAECL